MDILKKLSVTSDGTDNRHWASRLNQKGHTVVEGTDVWLKIAAMSSLQIFEVTNGVTTVVAVVNPKDKYNSYLSFKEASEKVGLKQLNAEVACLLCEKITKKDFQEMGVDRIKVMHKPFENVHLLEFFVLTVDDKHSKPIFGLDNYSGNENPFVGDNEAFAFAV